MSSHCLFLIASSFDASWLCLSWLTSFIFVREITITNIVSFTSCVIYSSVLNCCLIYTSVGLNCYFK